MTKHGRGGIKRRSRGPILDAVAALKGRAAWTFQSCTSTDRCMRLLQCSRCPRGRAAQTTHMRKESYISLMRRIRGLTVQSLPEEGAQHGPHRSNAIPVQSLPKRARSTNRTVTKSYRRPRSRIDPNRPGPIGHFGWLHLYNKTLHLSHTRCPSAPRCSSSATTTRERSTSRPRAPGVQRSNGPRMSRSSGAWCTAKQWAIPGAQRSNGRFLKQWGDSKPNSSRKGMRSSMYKA